MTALHIALQGDQDCAYRQVEPLKSNSTVAFSTFVTRLHRLKATGHEARSFLKDICEDVCQAQCQWQDFDRKGD